VQSIQEILISLVKESRVLLHFIITTFSVIYSDLSLFSKDVLATIFNILQDSYSDKNRYFDWASRVVVVSRIERWINGLIKKDLYCRPFCYELDALGGGRTLTPWGHMALNHACLPVPAPALEQPYYNQGVVNVKQFLHIDFMG